MEKTVMVSTLHWEEYMKNDRDIENTPLVIIQFPEPGPLDPPYKLQDILSSHNIIHFLTYMSEDMNGLEAHPTIKCQSIYEAAKVYNILDLMGTPIKTK